MKPRRCLTEHCQHLVLLVLELTTVIPMDDGSGNSYCSLVIVQTCVRRWKGGGRCQCLLSVAGAERFQKMVLQISYWFIIVMIIVRGLSGAVSVQRCKWLWCTGIGTYAIRVSRWQIFPHITVRHLYYYSREKIWNMESQKSAQIKEKRRQIKSVNWQQLNVGSGWSRSVLMRYHHILGEIHSALYSPLWIRGDQVHSLIQIYWNQMCLHYDKFQHEHQWVLGIRPAKYEGD